MGCARSTEPSLAFSIRNHVYENGRRYHSLSTGKYVLPNDEVSREWNEVTGIFMKGFTKT